MIKSVQDLKRERANVMQEIAIGKSSTGLMEKLFALNDAIEAAEDKVSHEFSSGVLSNS